MFCFYQQDVVLEAMGMGETMAQLPDRFGKTGHESAWRRLNSRIVDAAIDHTADITRPVNRILFTIARFVILRPEGRWRLL